MVPKNPWNNRTAAFAIAVAFLVGLVGSLAVSSNKMVRVSYCVHSFFL